MHADQKEEVNLIIHVTVCYDCVCVENPELTKAIVMMRTLL